MDLPKLTLAGTAMFVFVLLRVPETNLLGSYIQLVQSRRNLGYLSIAAAGSLPFQTAAPFIIVGELGVQSLDG